MVAGGLVTAASHGFALAVTGRLLSGIGAVLMNILLAKMVADWFAESELTTAMAIMLSSWPVGLGLAAATLGSVATSSSWRTAVASTAGAAPPPPPLLAFSLLGLLTGAAPGAVMALLPKTVAPERLATAFGVYYTVFYVVMALTQLGAGIVRDVVGRPAAPIVFAALVMSATVLGLALFRVAERAAPRADASAPRATRCL